MKNILVYFELNIIFQFEVEDGFSIVLNKNKTMSIISKNNIIAIIPPTHSIIIKDK